MAKLPYREGSCFSLPLRDYGYALGVVARAGRRGGLLVYLFGPRRDAPPGPDDVASLKPNQALKRIRCGDLRLIRREWQVIGEVPNWNREEWPMPYFIWREEGTRRARLIQYSESDLTKIEKEMPVPPEITGFEQNSLFGAGAVELFMTRVLSEN